MLGDCSIEWFLTKRWNGEVDAFEKMNHMKN
jgi:hypothetical protein